ncbi:uncharacterized protein B0T15DRAFT_209111 [Chaetomium strumarium]|uniref:Uncharacterized protein n=1 Tax=Chaetomium strumarium TaxID=1170767 RepID=A0AAJ0GTB8_9PEZI|nr:hypothetical protein B0T15DRAFT_209111 [Chaetomium strumarium]
MYWTYIRVLYIHPALLLYVVYSVLHLHAALGVTGGSQPAARGNKTMDLPNLRRSPYGWPRHEPQLIGQSGTAHICSRRIAYLSALCLLFPVLDAGSWIPLHQLHEAPGLRRNRSIRFVHVCIHVGCVCMYCGIVQDHSWDGDKVRGVYRLARVAPLLPITQSRQRLGHAGNIQVTEVF